jgi:hypothetical protein
MGLWLRHCLSDLMVLSLIDLLNTTMATGIRKWLTYLGKYLDLHFPEVHFQWWTTRIVMWVDFLNEFY